jgi:hypothetical protein
MTLGNMRANGVRSLDVCCWICHHRAIMSADPWSDDVPVPTFGPRMVCTRCGIISLARMCGPIRWKHPSGDNPDQHEALRMLAGSPHGCTQSVLRAHGFAIGMLLSLVVDRLAGAEAEKTRAGAQTITVVRLRITDAGRRALAGERD